MTLSVFTRLFYIIISKICQQKRVDFQKQITIPFFSLLSFILFSLQQNRRGASESSKLFSVNWVVMETTRNFSSGQTCKEKIPCEHFEARKIFLFKIKILLLVLVGHQITFKCIYLQSYSEISFWNVESILFIVYVSLCKFWL